MDASATPEPPETILVTTKTVACDGGTGPLGHPRVYLNLGQDDRIICPYCSRKYVLDPNSPAASDH